MNADVNRTDHTISISDITHYFYERRHVGMSEEESVVLRSQITKSVEAVAYTGKTPSGD